MTNLNTSTAPADVFMDQSGVRGPAGKIHFPKDSAAAAAILQQGETPLTIQGGLTGLNGGAVPVRGELISTARMTRVLSFSYDSQGHTGRIRVQAGVTLEQLNRLLTGKLLDADVLEPAARDAWASYCRSGDLLCFLPDPSEKAATIGGMLSVGVSCFSCAPGQDICRFVHGLHIVLPDGTEADVIRDQPLPVALSHLASDAESVLALYCGSEGIAGIITEAELYLVVDPDQQSVIQIPVHRDEDVLLLREALKTADLPGVTLRGTWYSQCCACLMQQLQPKGSQPRAGLQDAGLILEARYAQETDLFQLLELICLSCQQLGISDDQIQVATDPRQLEALKEWQHFLLDTVGQLSQARPCLSADIKIPAQQYRQVFRSSIQAMQASHIDGILWADLLTDEIGLRLLPEQDISEAEVLYQKLVKIWLGTGCSCSPRYGIGRKKMQLLSLLSPENTALRLRMASPQNAKHSLNAALIPAENTGVAE